MSMMHMILWAIALNAGTAWAAPPATSASRQQENPKVAPFTIEGPACQRDWKAWQAFSPARLRADPTLREMPQHQKQFSDADARWRREDAVDMFWVDLDGDGWCDVISSGDSEPYKHVKNTPVLLLQPRGAYLRTQDGFKPFVGGGLPSMLDGLSLAIYWEMSTGRVHMLWRWYQGGVVGGANAPIEAFHFRQMVRSAFAAIKAKDVDKEAAFYAEAEPMMYQGVFPVALAKTIWLEEAKRAGLDLPYPFVEK